MRSCAFLVCTFLLEGVAKVHKLLHLMILSLYAQAPSVVFIDELDAVGRERGLIKGSGGQERDATLNQVRLGIYKCFFI